MSDIATFDPAIDDRRDVARLLCLANPEFYEGIEIEPDARLDVLGALLATPGTDLEQVRVVRVDGRVAGIWCGLFPVEEMTGRQLKMLMLLSKPLDRAVWSAFQQRCSAYAKSLPSPPNGTLYLSRIAVHASHRGLGLGSALVQDFVASAGGRSISLHVRGDNRGAIHLYERAGFVRQPGEHDFALLVRNVLE